MTLKLKTVGFEVKTRSCTLAHYTNEETTILKAAQMLLQTEINAVLPDSLRLRLLGLCFFFVVELFDGRGVTKFFGWKRNLKLWKADVTIFFSCPDIHHIYSL